MVDDLCVKFGDLSRIGFWYTVRKNRQTNKQTNAGEDPTSATAVGVRNNAGRKVLLYDSKINAR